MPFTPYIGPLWIGVKGPPSDEAVVSAGERLFRISGVVGANGGRMKDSLGGSGDFGTSNVPCKCLTASSWSGTRLIIVFQSFGNHSQRVLLDGAKSNTLDSERDTPVGHSYVCSEQETSYYVPLRCIWKRD